MCKIDGLVQGQPIALASAEKYRSEPDFTDTGPAALSFTRTYRSNWSTDASRTAAAMGQVWTHNHNFILAASPSGAPVSVVITQPEGYIRQFSKAPGASVWTASGSADTLVQVGSAWTWKRADDDVAFNFDASGKLQTQVARNGWTTAYTYDGSGRLSTVSNAFGRWLLLAYANNKLATVTAPGGKVFGYTYDTAGRLVSVTYPDAKTRTFLYENATYPQALTGILDESGTRWGTFAYDAQGRAVSTSLAGSVSTYQVSYPSAGSATVIDPLGTSRSYSYGTAGGKLAVTSNSLPSGESEADAASRVQDANGLITSETDFKGIKTTTTWDTARRLPLTVVRAAGTPDAQTLTTSWHPTFSLPALVTEPGRSTAYSYDTQGRLLSEAVTDTLVSPNTTKTRSWTYNAQGLVATATEANGGVTSYTYDASGNVLSSTRPLGHVTTYTYDSANRLVTQTAPNGLVTTYTWDMRDRLLTQAVGTGTLAQTTTLTYHPTGTLATLALPSGLKLNYSYDAAHRLTGWTNNRSESGTFTLDAMGNRVGEQIKDSAGTVAWMASKSVNAINRVATATQGANQSSTFGYDANGERVRTTNGLNQSTQLGLNALRRVTRITDAANATASLGYDGLYDVTWAKDFKGVATSYGRDAQGNATVETSTDIGLRVGVYDALGLPQTLVDAMGQTTSVARDLLGRPTQLTFADGKTTTLTYGTSGPAKGYLTGIVDRSGTTAYTRDIFGRITSKQQTLTSGTTSQVSYGYQANGLASSVTYPGGGVLAYLYDTTGRLIQMNWAGQPLVTNIAWNPLGQPVGWKWEFGDASAATTLNAIRSYDTAGRTTATEFSSYQYDAAGRITGLTQNLLKPADAIATNSTVVSVPTSWAVTYDAVGRITGFNQTSPATLANTAGFGYDANGSRTASTRVIGNQTTSRSYTLPANGNRPAGFSQTIGTTTTSVAYGYNANGDLTSDGLNGFGYDAEGRMGSASVGTSDSSPTTRYAHNALGQRVFKTAPLFPIQGSTQGVLTAFRAKGWTPQTNAAERTGTAFTYDEDGNLIAETSSNPSSPGTTLYIYLPTAAGPMPVATVINGTHYAVSIDHLNTPRRLTSSAGQVMWQWGYSAFGEDQPTTATKRFTGPETIPTTGTTTATPVTFNLGFPGMYRDAETGLYYNYFRSYDPRTDTYTQNDPKGLSAGPNRRIYANANPLRFTDPRGLQVKGIRNPLSLLEGGGSGTGNGGGGGLTLGMIGAGAGAWIGSNITGPMLNTDPMMSSGLPPGFWPADKGAEEWGRRNGVGRREGKGRFHGIKQGCGGRATDNFGVDPETGEVIDPEGESVLAASLTTSSTTLG